jgi:hypothetical protein
MATPKPERHFQKNLVLLCMLQSSAALAATSDERRRQELQKAEFMLTMQVWQSVNPDLW